MVTKLVQVMEFAYPTVVLGVDAMARDNRDGTGQFLILWNTAKHGPQPTQQDLEAIEQSQAFKDYWSQAAIDARTRDALRAAATALLSDPAAAMKVMRAVKTMLVDEFATIYGGLLRPIVSITRSGTTATVTTYVAHNLTTGATVFLCGAAVAAYNGAKAITVTGATTFTYAVAGSPTTPAAGSLFFAPDGTVNPPVTRTNAQANTAIQNKITNGDAD